ncbi:hypothetical protein IFM89_016578 [Coptis chinensis]|uniref:Uncharacterized protein n=1 Tax=Coptis chinensis TaxID=261450 RepID=A0A835I4J5_9MAGN|nr:hypothetical protein IFM89_016578 [Coptis chinensis]
MLKISDEGKVLSWGHGGHGQLGHSPIQNVKIPTVVEALAEEQVVYVACEGSSSATITATHVFVVYEYSLQLKQVQLDVDMLDNRKCALEVLMLTNPLVPTYAKKLDILMQSHSSTVKERNFDL